MAIKHGRLKDEFENVLYPKTTQSDVVVSESDEAPQSSTLSTINAKLEQKVTAVSGKGLSENDYTTAEKEKLSGIESEANKYTHPSYSEKPSGLYKVTVDTSGHVSGTEAATKSDVGLSNVDNTADADKNVASAEKLTTPRAINGVLFDGTASITIADETKIPTTQRGAANGIAEQDETGKVLASQLPSYVDDVLEQGSVADFPAQGESGKIYIAIDSNITYRWGGTTYVAIGSDLAIGETDSSAYRGDRGKIAYDHSQTAHAPADANNYVHPVFPARASGLYKVTIDAQGHVTEVVAVAKEDITALGIPGQDTNTVYTHPNSGAAAGTYRSVTVNTQGHVTAGSNPTVAVTEGGTGATTPAAALTNLGAAPTSHTHSQYLTAHQDISGKANASEVVPLSATANTDGSFDRGAITPTGTSKLNYSGYFEATRVYGGYYSDYAEFFDVRGEITPGDVAALDPDTGEIRRCERDASPHVVGVVSNAYFICIGRKEGESNVPVGLAGKLPVKVRGVCRAGDKLVSAGDGFARALRENETPPIGAMLGMALERKATPEPALVQMLIK